MERATERTPLYKRTKWIRRLFGGGWQYKTAQLLKQQSLDLKGAKVAEALRGNSLKDVLDELEANVGDSTQNMFLGFLLVLLHIGIGIVAMVYLEDWHPRDAAYFCIVAITTVGYGDLSPTTHESKVFVIFYVIISIGLVASYLSHFVGVFLDEQEHMLFAKSIEKRESQIEEMISGDFDAKILHATRAFDWEDYFHLGFSLLFLFVVSLVGTYTFMTYEQLSFTDALYLVVISASTVGFGDQHPKHPVSRYIMMIWLIFATVSVANMIGEITRCRMQAKQRALTRRVLTVPIGKPGLDKLDVNRSGTVSWGDFLAGMMVRTGQIEKRDVEMYRLRFQELKPDQNGMVKVAEFGDIVRE